MVKRRHGGVHAGMDGWHHLRVHVPITDSGSTDQLALSGTGDFHP